MKTHSSRILPGALSAVLVLGACGSGDEPAGDSPIDPVVEQPGLRTPTPIKITSGGNADRTAALGAESADGAASSDMMIAPAYWISEYVVGAGMPALPTNDLGYVFDASREVTADQVATIAAALGVVGEPVHLVEEWGSSWRVGPDDGSAPSLWVSEDSQQSWNYSSAWQDREAIAGCAVAVDSEGNESGECPELEPPVGVPTTAEAEQRGREILVALGEDPAALEVESYGDEWFANVTFSDATDDRAALRQWSFGFGADGVMEWASGLLSQAEPVGPYPLIDIDTALARLNDGNYGYGGYRGGIDTAIAVAEGPPADVAVDEAIAVDMLESDVVEGSTGGEEATTDAVGETDIIVDDEVQMPETEPDSPEPMPIEEPPVGEPPIEPESVVVTLVDVQADLWWAWDVDGSVWLLPAYRFIDTDGGWHVVPAVTDEFMIETEPPVFVGEPLPLPEPMPIEVVPEPTPEPMPIEEPPIGEPPIEPGPGEAIIVELNQILPLPLDEFTDRAAVLGLTTRIVVQDGEALAVTADFSETRVNVVAEGDTVVEVQSVG